MIDPILIVPLVAAVASLFFMAVACVRLYHLHTEAGHRSFSGLAEGLFNVHRYWMAREAREAGELLPRRVEMPSELQIEPEAEAAEDDARKAVHKRWSKRRPAASQRAHPKTGLVVPIGKPAGKAQREVGGERRKLRALSIRRLAAPRTTAPVSEVMAVHADGLIAHYDGSGKLSGYSSTSERLIIKPH